MNALWGFIVLVHQTTNAHLTERIGCGNIKFSRLRLEIRISNKPKNFKPILAHFVYQRRFTTSSNGYVYFPCSENWRLY
ncbi:hypothetical protein BABINDRAFT_85258 [Babjeviella inositovora NRRL Y-12698]|uniref:Uncharacterized protein n=1 Tax=Babjeviella inositovora NRRL Y-12698 TaxID=984486 RepID=A0A1E3QLA8_9ASCO|nr:uncharacterized protein BABINDRAFT_85258 [Babjeviella inositovora NRRL Y-12698]ODQ78489.1 hypothetical protein BABINDRAFT_85258 [Babjeviella inositovora NRRL Y-12698]